MVDENKIPIDKDVPIPKEMAERGRRVMYPITDMEVGDSFEIEPEKLKSIRSVIWKHKSKSPEQDFYVQQGDDDKYRVWRTK